MKESIDTGLSAFFKDRLTNPIISSFAISWSLYNYKFYVILFSDNSVTEMSALIAERFPDLAAILVHGLFWPGTFAGLYLFGSPYVTAWYYGWLRERQKKVYEARYAIESEQRLTVEESRMVRAQVRAKELQIDELEAKIVKAKDDLKDADRRLSEANTKIRAGEDDVNALRDATQRLEQQEKKIADLKTELHRTEAVFAESRSRAVAAEQRADELQAELDIVRSIELMLPVADEETTEVPAIAIAMRKVADYIRSFPEQDAETIAERLSYTHSDVDYLLDRLVKIRLIKANQKNGRLHYELTERGQVALTAGKNSSKRTLP